MKSRIIIIICFLGVFFSVKIYGQNNQIDSIKIVSLDAGYTYVPFGSYDVESLKDFLDDKLSWTRFEPNSKIEYKCVLKNRNLLNKFQQLLSKCQPSHNVDLSNFSRILVRIGLKIYNHNHIEYMFIQVKSRDHPHPYIITKTTELQPSDTLIRFFRKMKRNRLCSRCYY